VFVYGNGYKSYTVAIVVPDAEVLEKYAREKNLSGDIEELCKKKEIKELIFNDIKQLEKANSLKGFETVSLDLI
jgi:long-subunit acyl-CoA synthetase (AMP-forming)